ncbi:MAG: hypothetical protein ACETWG_04040, partial [Candidatus Neomarinimicrobiota bacterium]
MTLGRERFSPSGISTQFQVDASLIQSTYHGRRETPGGGNRHRSGILVTASMGLNLFTSSSRLGTAPRSHAVPRTLPVALAQVKPPKKQQPQFDPATGEPLDQKPELRFDPLTGLTLEAEPDTTQLRFDPATGEPLPFPSVIREPTVAAAEVLPLTEAEIRTLAVAEAAKHHERGIWQVGGG